jgi:hypothetical protein
MVTGAQVAETRLGMAYASGLVPPFRAADRNRWASEVAGRWSPSEAVRVSARWSWLQDSTSNGDITRGPGDLVLQTTAFPVRGGPVEVGLSWAVKLPNAQDEGELGTDETDATITGVLAGSQGSLDWSTTAGLAILGNPLRFANQDDVPLAWAAAGLPVGPVRLGARAGGELATARNPARMEAALGAETVCPTLSGLEASAGLTPAAADWSVRAWVGWGAGCER